MILKILCHPVTKVILALIGFFASFYFVRSVSRAFDFYAGFHFGFLAYTRFAIRIFSLFILVICIVLLMLAVWFTRPSKISLWHRIDIFLLALIEVSLVIFSIRVLFLRPTSINVTLIIPLVVYFFTLFIFIQFVARVRDKLLNSTLYWWRFFNLPHLLPKFAMGLLLAVLLVLLASETLGAFGLITNNFNLSRFSIFLQGNFFRFVFDSPFGIENFRIFIFSITPVFLLHSTIVVALCILNYFASYILGLSSQYELANTEKVRAERFKAELITNVSHDIRTPLTSIINYTGLLKKQQLKGDAAEYVNVLEKKSSRLKQLLNDLIDASQASTGAIKLDIEPLNLPEMLGQVAGEFSDIFYANNLTLVLRQPDEPLYVQADSRQLYRAMENVFSNAAKYSLEGTRVFAEIREFVNPTNSQIPGYRNRKQAYFVLRNTSKSHIDSPIENLTEQFIRGDLARHSEGSGLGLYIAKSLVELMGGQLDVNLRGDLFEVKIRI